ncbi:hypothetical protein Pla175_23120 [Pirellulimonas nuda]|uniref:LamG-like jellyroll fold domain-containing protein n=1 Tax=Pirellulimonas nuda TaxID=2528009 RepID=A0A518DBT5_9BACT|nr:LamG domain-containing protein [Pirellulimonas nuda]QDU88928.1 hypothetical protein Pla175_23120 [Pirellulimonas nuda]
MNRFLSYAVLVGSVLAVSSSQAVLVGHWQFQEGAGATAANSVVGGAVGAITNDATGGLGVDGSVWATDPVFGSVISFNGGAADAGFVRAGSLPILTLEQDFTWAFLANNQEPTQPNNIIVGNRRDGGSPEAEFTPRQFIKFTPTNFEWHMNANTNDNFNVADLTVGYWNHHAVVKDGAQLTYYRNGVEMAAQTITQFPDVAMPLFFGGDSTATNGENWRGFLDEVRIYDEALSASAVQALVPPSLQFLAGDVNDDGNITVADDFEPIRANFLQVVSSRAQGDLTRDGFVDYDDWNEFKVAFLGAGGDLSSLQGLPVPEPSAAVLLALLASTVALGRRCKQ